ncbi:MAG: SpoIIE family protein phosphatase [Deltaproteobacteria bacterium]|nr:SpoIIE family protein phosphatase [Deltaproteobacteria bacterium]
MHRQFTKALSWIAFALVQVFALSIAGLYLLNIFHWAECPDFGYGFRTASGIHVVGIVSERAQQAGMRVGDRILSVNDRTFKSMEELRSSLVKEIGGENRYRLDRGGKEMTIRIRNAPVGLAESFRRSGFLFLLGLAYALTGSIVFLMKPHTRPSWVLFVFCTTLCIFIMFLYRVSELTPPWLESFHIFAYTITPAVLIHLALSFPHERSWLLKRTHFVGLPYAVSLILFFYTCGAAHTLSESPGSCRIGSALFLACGVVVLLGSCLQTWLRSTSEIAKVRAKLLLTGFAISASVPVLDLLSTALFNVVILPGFNSYLAFFIVFPIFLGYGIVRHDLFEIDTFIKRTYGYILATGAVSAAYGLFVVLANLALGHFQFADSPLIPLAFFLAVLCLFNPIRSRFQRFIDRVFYRLDYDYQETVQKVGESLRSLLRLDEVVRTVMDFALGTMFIECGCVMLLDEGGHAYECVAVEGLGRPCVDGETSETVQAGGMERVLPAVHCNGNADRKAGKFPKLSVEDPLVRILAQTRKEIILHDLEENPLFAEEREVCKAVFTRLGAAILVPFIYEKRLTGIIALGRKKSGKPYRREDVNLLRTIANQGAVAIENARRLDQVIEKERMEEELAIARDLQVSMLPAVTPRLQGFDIAAVSIPAREVGGDFYDFIEIEDGKWGIVLGDVMGKSVSGALVTAACRSIFRMLSEQGLSREQLMRQANRRVRSDIKKGLSVALVYAVVDEKSCSISLTNAGQPQPVCYSGESGEARLVENPGDTVPLGIVEDANYEEVRIDLHPGDRMVFYTDGVVESFNEKGELFGFDRLLQTVRAAGSLDCRNLLVHTLQAVSTFCGGSREHDDLTMIVLGVAER